VLITFILLLENTGVTQVGAQAMNMLIKSFDSETLPGLVCHVTH